MEYGWEREEVANQYRNELIWGWGSSLRERKKFMHDPLFLDLIVGRVNNGDHLLEIGGGGLRMPRQVLKKVPGLEVTMIDFPAVTSKIWNFDSRINVIPGRAEQIPLPDQSCDFVESAMVFHWVQDIQGAFAEANRVLKDGGQFLWSIANPELFRLGKFKRWGEVTGKEMNVSLLEMVKRRMKEIVLRDCEINDMRIWIQQKILVEGCEEVKLGDKIGPVTYYRRTPETYKQIMSQSGFTDIRWGSPNPKFKEIAKRFPPSKVRYAYEPTFSYCLGTKE